MRGPKTRGQVNYNYVRIHTTLRVTPAMAAGVSQKLWSMEDVVTMIEEWEAIV